MLTKSRHPPFVSSGSTASLPFNCVALNGGDCKRLHQYNLGEFFLSFHDIEACILSMAPLIVKPAMLWINTCIIITLNIRFSYSELTLDEHHPTSEQLVWVYSRTQTSSKMCLFHFRLKSSLLNKQKRTLTRRAACTSQWPSTLRSSSSAWLIWPTSTLCTSTHWNGSSGSSSMVSAMLKEQVGTAVAPLLESRKFYQSSSILTQPWPLPMEHFLWCIPLSYANWQGALHNTGPKTVYFKLVYILMGGMGARVPHYFEPSYHVFNSLFFKPSFFIHSSP